VRGKRFTPHPLSSLPAGFALDIATRENAAVDGPRVDADLVSGKENILAGGMAENDRLSPVVGGEEKILPDPEHIARVLPGQRYAGAQSGMDKNEAFGLVTEFQIFEKIEMRLGNAQLRTFTVLLQRTLAAVVVVKKLVAPGDEIEKHLLVVSFQEYGARKFPAEGDKVFENTPGIGSAIDVVAEEDNKVLFRWLNFGHKSFELRETSVDVPHRQHTPLGALFFFCFWLRLSEYFHGDIIPSIPLYFTGLIFSGKLRSVHSSFFKEI
jgi:hypothetical protein